MLLYHPTSDIILEAKILDNPDYEGITEFQQKKSTHKLRKTFCSILLDTGVDNNLVISVMGHIDINTSEKYYHYDRKSDTQKQEVLDNIVEFKKIVNG